MNVWTYWEGPKPAYIDVCLRSMERVCHDVDFHLVTPENLGEYVPAGTIHENYRTLQQPALRADCIRAALLALHGGWWWDADTIGLQSPRGLTEDNATASVLYFTWTKPPVRVLNGYIYAEAGCAIAASWLRRVNYALANPDEEVEWCSLGERALTLMTLADPRARELPRAKVLPIDIDSNVASFFEPGSPGGVTGAGPVPVCFGLNHSWFMYHRAEDMAPDKWAGSPLLIHRLLEGAA